MQWRTAIAVTVALVAACSERGASYPERSAPAGFLEDTGNAALGRALFEEKCAYCHGTVAEGRIARANSYTPPPSDFTSPKYRSADPAYLYWRIESGKQAEPYRSRGSVMPAWGPYLSEEEIWQLVSYIRTRPAVGEGK